MAGDKTIGNLTVVYKGNTRSYDNAAKHIKKGNNDLIGQFGAIKNKLLGVFAVGAMVAWGNEASKAAARGEGIKNAFEALNRPDMLDNLRTATRGTVSDLSLMQNSVKADKFKVPLENLADYFKFAQIRAEETGESVDYLVESIITGIARKSIPIMDNLGISSVELQKEVKKAGDFGAAAANIISRELAKSNTVIETSQTVTDQLTASFENWKIRGGDLINTVLTPMKKGLIALLTPQKSVSDGMLEQQTKANLLAIQLTNTNTSEAQRVKILEELNKISPDIVKGLTAEKIEVGLLKDNLRKYNEELVKKIAIQQSEELVATQREKLGKQEAKRIEDEQKLEEQLLNIHKKIVSVDEDAAKRIDNILTSKKDVLEKEKEINKVVAEINMRDKAHYASTNMAALLSSRIVDSREKELSLQTALEEKTKEYEDTYRRIYGLTADGDILTKQQRDQIDNYNRLFETSLDYSKALDTQQLKELAEKDVVVEIIPLLQAANDKLKELTESRDAAITEDQLAKYNQLIAIQKAEIANLEKMGTIRPKIAPIKAVSLKASVSADTSGMNMPEVLDPKPYTFSFDQIKEKGLEMSDVLSNAFANMAIGFAESLGSILSGEADFGSLFNNLLAVVADFMSMLGKALIAAAVASEAFSKLFSNPLLGIAAGTALIALAAVVKNALTTGPQAAKMATGGIVPAGFPNDTFPALLSSGETVLPSPHALPSMAMAGGAIKIEVSGTLRGHGNELLGIIDRATIVKNRLG